MVVTDSDIRIVFVSNYYDHPLSGVCVYKGKVCEFTREYGEDEIFVKELNAKERFLKWVRRTMFGVCVGWHWHYGKDGKRARFFNWRKPAWLSKALFNWYYYGSPFRSKRASSGL